MIQDYCEQISHRIRSGKLAIKIDAPEIRGNEEHCVVAAGKSICSFAPFTERTDAKGTGTKNNKTVFFTFHGYRKGI